MGACEEDQLLVEEWLQWRIYNRPLTVVAVVVGVEAMERRLGRREACNVYLSLCGESEEGEHSGGLAMQHTTHPEHVSPEVGKSQILRR